MSYLSGTPSLHIHLHHINNPLFLKHSTKIVYSVVTLYDSRTTGENSHYGTPTNPAMPSYIPGGSSSGSAVAVAAELVDFSIGIDFSLIVIEQ